MTGLATSATDDGPAAAATRRVRVLATVTLNPNQLRAHLEPILDLPEVERATLVADVTGPPLPKLRSVVPPRALTRLVGRAAAKWLAMLGVAVRERPDWVIGYNLVPHGLNAVAVAALTRRRSLIHLIGGPREWEGGGWTSDNKLLRRVDRPIRLLERLLLAGIRRADAVAVMGSDARAALIAHGCVPARVFVLPASVDFERFGEAGEAPRRFDVVCVSQLIPRKRITDLLAATEALAAKRPGLRVALAGRGRIEHEIRAEVQRRGLEDTVEFLGFVADVERLYAECAVFVLPSRSEGLPIAVCEAMAAGLAIVATDVGEIRDIVTPGVDGELFAVGDVAALERLVAGLLDDDERRAAMGRAARASVRGHCSRERVRDVGRELLLASRSDRA